MDGPDVGLPWLVVLLGDVLGHHLAEAGFARPAALDHVAASLVHGHDVVVLVEHLQVVFGAVDNGGLGFFDKPMKGPVVSAALRGVAVGHQYCSDSFGKSTARTSVTY